MTLCKLQFPRQRRARVDWADSRLRTCERIRRPLLNVRSTSTEVAIQTLRSLNICNQENIEKYRTRDAEVV